MNLEKIFDTELHSDLKQLVITQDQAGNLYLFNKYKIAKRNDDSYLVSTPQVKACFFDVKHAVAYVILLNDNRTHLARQMELLDMSLSSVKFNLLNHRRILKNKKDSEYSLIYETKIKEDVIRKRQILSEIKSHINYSIDIQKRKFDTALNKKNQRLR